MLFFDCVMSASVSMSTHSVYCMLSCVLSLKETLVSHNVDPCYLCSDHNTTFMVSKSPLFVDHSVVINMKHRCAYLLVLCCRLIHMYMLGSYSYHTVGKEGALSFIVGQPVACLYPLLGWLTAWCLLFQIQVCSRILHHHDSNHCCHGYYCYVYEVDRY